MARQSHWNPMDDLLKGMQAVQGWHDTQERRELRQQEAERTAEAHDLRMAQGRLQQDLAQSQEERAAEAHDLNRQLKSLQIGEAEREAQMTEWGRRLNAHRVASETGDGFNEEQFDALVAQDSELHDVLNMVVQDVAGDPQAQFVGLTDPMEGGAAGVRFLNGDGEQDILADGPGEDAEAFLVQHDMPGVGLAALAYADPEEADRIIARRREREADRAYVEAFEAARGLDEIQVSDDDYYRPGLRERRQEVGRQFRGRLDEMGDLMGQVVEGGRGRIGMDPWQESPWAPSQAQQPEGAQPAPGGMGSDRPEGSAGHGLGSPTPSGTGSLLDRAHDAIFRPAIQAGAKDARHTPTADDEPGQGDTGQTAGSPRLPNQQSQQADEMGRLIHDARQLRAMDEQLGQAAAQEREGMRRQAEEHNTRVRATRTALDAVRDGRMSREVFREEILPLMQEERSTVDRVHTIERDGAEWIIQRDEHGNEVGQPLRKRDLEEANVSADDLMKQAEYLGAPPQLAAALAMDNQARGIQMDDTDSLVGLATTNEILQSGVGGRNWWPGNWGKRSGVEDYSVAEMSLAPAAAQMGLEWGDLERDYMRPIAGARDRGEIGDADRVMRGVTDAYLELTRNRNVPHERAHAIIRRNILGDPQALREIDQDSSLDFQPLGQ